jgi:outer membrane lipoprotein SlyB
MNDMTELRQVQATFADSDRMQDAVSQLSTSGFDRADISLPSAAGSSSALTAGSKPAATEADARQTRTLGASLAGTAAALAATGATIASGGGAVPAVAAAAAAGGIAGGATFAVFGASGKAEQQDREARAADGELVLTVRARTPAMQSEAEAILRAAGAAHIETV